MALSIERNGQTFQVKQDGQVLFEGSMLEANREYSRRMAEQLEAKGTTRKRKIYR